jgi:outer membrane protein
MKRYLTPILTLVFAANLATSAMAQTKVAVVDMKKVFDGYWRTKEADRQLKERAADFEKARGGIVEDYKKANEEFGKLRESANDPAVSEDERNNRKKSLEKKVGELREQENSLRTFDQNMRQSIADQQLRLRESVLRDIKGVVEEKAKAGSYQLVVDTAAISANQTPIVVYTTLLGGDSDLSDGVLKQLNANAPPESAKPAEKTEEKKDDKK